MMIPLLLICALSLPCFAVDTGQDIDGRSKDLFARWLELRKQIYDEFSLLALYPDRMKAILLEMASIEQTEVYKSQIKPNLGNDQYLHLLSRYYKAKLLNKRDSSMTDLLLQTFDYDSNDCTGEYLEQLNDIYNTLVHTPFSGTLRENRELQYQNCWHRLMRSLVANSMLLSSNVRIPLDKLTSLAFPNHDELLSLSSDPSSTSYKNESNQISKIIAQFLQSLGGEIKTLRGYRDHFERLVEHPCEMLIDTTNQVMSRIYRLLKLCGRKRDFISSNYVMILNGSMLCDRVIGDLESIRLQVIRYSAAPRSIIGKDIVLDVFDRAMPTDIQRTTDNESDLVTQYPLTGIHVNQQMLANLGSNISGGPEAQVADPFPISVAHANMHSSMQIPHISVPAEKHVLKIFPPIHRDNRSMYPTFWSDTSFSFELKDYLRQNWYSEWLEQLSEQSAKNQRKRDAQYALAMGLQSPIVYKPPDKVHSGDQNPEPIRIDRPIGRGLYAKYPTVWSDGSASMETKKYLKTNWNKVWMILARDQKRARTKRWRDKKMSEKNERDQSDN